MCNLTHVQDSSPHQLAANVSFESQVNTRPSFKNVLKLQIQADFGLFIEVLDMVRRVNQEMASGSVGGMDGIKEIAVDGVNIVHP